ncbi:GH92 family glycosyl hydrolase [Sphingobacterium sp. JB170]|uniref:GH92 family glycosyl hydrolase n=1 Tax=Sphingobacterium sp. JB170 TaxID=1434842 RepID=UPI00097F03CF|nr:GH92 family glycosyl hydrolase [Sphingobacterium sp. JB170]SJN48813.1 Alpha-1,2-mannosidase [Sphingobacterium sp. JB170]
MMITINKLLNVFFYLVLCMTFGASSLYGQQSVVWSIGKNDNQAADMALYPDAYEDFLGHDFGYEDRYFMIGSSESKTDFPFVLPGPDNSWGGTGRTAGIRSHFITLGFELATASEETGNSSANENDGAWRLSLDLLDVDPQHGVVLKMQVNGKPFVYNLSSKKSSATARTTQEAKKTETPPVGPFSNQDQQLLDIALPSGLIKPGYNEIIITSLDGGWVAFDQLKLTGAGSAAIKPKAGAIIRNVSAAKFQTKEGAQPLLVDVIHARANTRLSVILDNEEIYNVNLDSGRSVLEAPMPVVIDDKESSYEIFVDGQKQTAGNINRSAQPIAGPADYVSTMMGAAHSRWMIAPGPWMPFSMVKLSPDNQNGGWQAGYDPTFESIGTFSHIHEWTMAGLGTFPVRGELITDVGDQSGAHGGYRSRIDKTTEEAPLGYYKVDLTDYDIQAELTALTRSSFQRYTYNQGDTGRVMIDLKIPSEYNYDLHKVNITKVSPQRIEGTSEQFSKHVWSGDVNQDYTIYFVIEFDQPIVRYGSWLNDQVSLGKELLADSANTAGLFAEFDLQKSRTVQLRTGISFVSLENAAENLQQEIAEPYGWSFDAVKQQNLDTWNALLSRVEISSDNWLQKHKFYSNMYRTLASRNTFSDVDGRWRSADEKIQQFSDKQDVALGCDAFWNTFWNLNQFWNLVTPEWSNKWVRSQLAMYDANGWLAKGPAGMEYVPVMVAEHEIPLIVGAYQMGIRDYDVEKAYEAVKKMQTTKATSVAGGFAGNRDLETYLAHKYVPYDKGRFSNSMEYSFDDWTVGQLAKALGKMDDYELFNDRGQWWKNAIDSQTGYARLRDSKGDWLEDFDPFKSGANKHYVEGNAWQLTFFVPQDVPALAETIGKDKFVERLEWGFQESTKWRYNGPNDQYWDYPVVQGNQQSMHFAYLFNWVGKPWLTQKWSRSIGERYYGSGVSNAYLGDEDQGQMSAWYLMNALGLFQTDGGTSIEPQYEIGSPLFEKVTIDLAGQYGRGESFTIEAKNTSKTNIYVQRALLNGKPLYDFKFPASEVLKGGSLVLEMGPNPNKSWGQGDLKKQIQSDGRLQAVKDKATELVKSGFTAGDGYAEVWIRDYNTFISLASGLHEHEKTKENLRVFFRLQGKDGNIVDGFIPAEKAKQSKVSYQYIYSDLEPNYAGHKNTVETDQESSLIQAVYKYIQASGDDAFLAESIAGVTVKKRLARALDFLMEHRLNKKYGLLWGATTADWGDVQPEHPWGVVLDENSHLAIDIYDNAMFLVALDNYLTMDPEDAPKWQKIRADIARNTMEHLWDESRTKFKPHIYLKNSPFAKTFNEDEVFYHGGTAIALEANLLSKAQARASFDKMIDNVQKSGAPSVGLTLYPTYPAGSFQNKGMAPYDYQNGGDWTWFGGRVIKQMIKMGFYQDAYEQLVPMLDRVLSNDGFYEYYSRDNQPSGSGSFRGSAGVLYDAILLLQEYAAH